MSTQRACLREDKVTLIAFVWLYSTVCFDMSPQIACVGGCIVTKVAFVWLFPTVRFQMPPHIACPRECRVTLVAFVWFFHCASSSVSSNCLSQRMDWLHSLDFFPSFLFVIGTFSSTLFSLNWFISKFDLSPSNNWCFFWYGWLLTGKYSRLYIVLE